MTPAALVLCALLIGLALFQLSLAAGAPIGRFAWGGEHRVLPRRLRLGSIVSTALYTVFVVVVLDRANLVSCLPNQVAHVGIWLIAAIVLLSAIANLMSRSKPERYGMAPLALVLSCLSLAIALG